MAMACGWDTRFAVFERSAGQLPGSHSHGRSHKAPAVRDQDSVRPGRQLGAGSERSQRCRTCSYGRAHGSSRSPSNCMCGTIPQPISFVFAAAHRAVSFANTRPTSSRPPAPTRRSTSRHRGGRWPPLGRRPSPPCCRSPEEVPNHDRSPTGLRNPSDTRTGMPSCWRSVCTRWTPTSTTIATIATPATARHRGLRRPLRPAGSGVFCVPFRLRPPPFYRIVVAHPYQLSDRLGRPIGSVRRYPPPYP